MPYLVRPQLTRTDCQSNFANRDALIFNLSFISRERPCHIESKCFTAKIIKANASKMISTQVCIDNYLKLTDLPTSDALK